jgi:rRNA maturation endonuclease Nob1
MIICCDNFADHLDPFRHSIVQFEQKDDGEWCIEGCCHGCYVVCNMKYCPYCGTEIDIDEKSQN